MRDYTVQTVATALFKHYSTFGSYDSFYSDPGRAFTSNVLDQLNKWIGIPHHISLVGRHEYNGTGHVNAHFLGRLRRLVHDERFTHKWASDTVLPLINHALMTMPNTEIGGISPIELKFGTRDHPRFKLPDPLLPDHAYNDLVTVLDHNLSIVRSITSDYQKSLRLKRQSLTPPTFQNTFQPGNYILWNPLENFPSVQLNFRLECSDLTKFCVRQRTTSLVNMLSLTLFTNCKQIESHLSSALPPKHTPLRYLTEMSTSSIRSSLIEAIRRKSVLLNSLYAGITTLRDTMLGNHGQR